MAGAEGPRRALEALLNACFSPSDFSRLVRFSLSREAAEQLPAVRAGTPQDFFRAAISALVRLGHVDAMLFEAIQEARPRRAAQVAQVAAQWPDLAEPRPGGVQHGAPPPPESAPWHEPLAAFLTKTLRPFELSLLLSGQADHVLPDVGLPAARFFPRAVARLGAAGLIDGPFFDALLEARPRFQAEIQDLRAAWRSA